MLPAAVHATNSREHASFISLEEFAKVGECLAYHADGCTGIDECRDRVRFRIFEANCAACLNDITRIHYHDLDARPSVIVVRRIPVELSASHIYETKYIGSVVQTCFMRKLRL